MNTISSSPAFTELQSLIRDRALSKEASRDEILSAAIFDLKKHIASKQANLKGQNL